MMAFSGVRISCDTVDTNRRFARFAALAWWSASFRRLTSESTYTESATIVSNRPIPAPRCACQNELVYSTIEKPMPLNARVLSRYNLP